MKRTAVGGIAAVALVGAFAGCASGGGGSGGAMQAEFNQEITPILTANCTGCHGNTRALAGINLEFANLNAAQAQDDAFWTRVVNAVSSGRMPPATAPTRPTDAQRAHLVEWIGENLID